MGLCSLPVSYLEPYHGGGNEDNGDLLQKVIALIIVNTFFQQHKRRIYTWTSPNGQYQNQIDYILCSQRWRTFIQSAKTRPGSDHELLIAKFRLKLKKVGKISRPFSSVQFSHSVASNSLWPHEPQHTRPPCPSPTPGVHPNPCPLSQWCHPAISSSVVPFLLLPSFFSQHQGLFQWVSSLHQKPFRYDLNQIHYHYRVEVRNRFKGLDLKEFMKNYGWRFVTLYRRQGSRPSPRKRNSKKQNGCLRRPYK